MIKVGFTRRDRGFGCQITIREDIRVLRGLGHRWERSLKMGGTEAWKEKHSVYIRG